MGFHYRWPAPVAGPHGSHDKGQEAARKGRKKHVSDPQGVARDDAWQRVDFSDGFFKLIVLRVRFPPW